MTVTRRCEFLSCSIAVAVAIIVPGRILGAEPSPAYIADRLVDRITSTQGWGELGLNTAAHKPADGPAQKLRIKEAKYSRGLGHHANGEISVTLDGQYKTFECEVGIQWQGGKNIGSVVFQVFADDKKVFDSGVMRENDPAKKVTVSVEGAGELRLVAADAGDGIACDCADWVEARLMPNPAAKNHAAAAVNIAPFARVVTSDPKRMKGTAAKRVEEVPAEDVFLDAELKPAADGSYALPATTDGPGSIGLRWYEKRSLRRLELHWADAAAMPSPDAVQLQFWADVSPTQFWTGSSLWQGEWKPLPAKCDTSSDVWSWQIAKDQPAGTYRVRWVFPASKRPIRINRIAAYSRSSWTTADLHLELQQPMAGKSMQVVVTNGNLLGATEQDVALTRSWDASKSLELKVRYSRPRPQKADRTVLQFEFAGQPISVAVEDVVAHGSVYVPCVGLFVTAVPSKMTLAQYLQQIADKKTVLEQVRAQPDQTFAQAMAKTRNPTQKNGPMLLALACDNRKYIVDRGGAMDFDLYDAPDGDYPNFPSPQQNWIFVGKHYRIAPQFGSSKGSLTRHLDGGWLPKPATTVTEDGVTYRQCTYVAPIDEKAPEGCPSWYRHRAVCVAEYAIENTRTTDADVAIKLAFLQDGKHLAANKLQEVKDGLIAVQDNRLLAFFDASQSMPLSLEKRDDGIRLAGKLAAGKSIRLFVYLPAWSVKSAEYACLRDAARWTQNVERYWNERLVGGMQIDIPDPLLANLIRASQMHCLIVARNEDRGRYVAPWIAATVYGPLESEAQAIIRGMDMCGQTDFARRGLEFFLKRYSKQGFLTTGYTLCGTGEHLWTLAEHHARRNDCEWLKTVAPQLVKTCKWIVNQRAKTKGKDADGRSTPEYGLMPPGVTADWERYAYRFFNDTQFCHGLETVGKALATIGHPDAASILADAKLYRQDLLRAYHWTQARCPVVALCNGTWVPNHPAMLDVLGNVEEMIAPNEDANRSWCYSVEIGSHHMAANRLLDPQSNDVAWMMDYLEDHQFLRSGWFDYSEEQNRKDVFSLGGFSKVQPYYSRNAEICALRDDVKPFIRSYFNTVSTLLNEENLSLWEHFHNAGAWNKTHETGWFLCQTAIMFVMERGDDLWLAPFVTNKWLKDGQNVTVRNAPTLFGPVGYRIVSHVRDGYIDASVDSPKRNPPKQIVLRIRHPEGSAMKAVAVNGKLHTDFDRRKETIRLTPSQEPIHIHVEYDPVEYGARESAGQNR